MSDETAIPIACDERVSSLVVLFTHRGERFASVVCKYVARLIENEPAMVLPPSPLVTRDEYASEDPESPLALPCEIAPRLYAADVIFRGSAFQPPHTEGPSRVVGIGLHRNGEPLLHKLLYVYGDRTAGVPRNFTRVPIEWQRAFGGPGYELNPAGCGLAGDDPAPNIVDPRNGRHPAGYWAISPRWPLRRKLLGNHRQEAVEGTRIAIPADVPFSFFQCAPHDQRLRYLAGDEWLVLDGLHPIAQRFQARLPGLRPVAELSRPGPESAGAAPMNLDMLSIDGDTLRVSVVFRYTFEIHGDVTDYVARVGVSIEGEVTAFPSFPPFRDSIGRPARVASLEDTAAIGPETQRAAASRAATPYGDSPPRIGIVAEAPGAPWVGPANPAPAPQMGAGTLRLIIADAPPELRALVHKYAETGAAVAPPSLVMPPATRPSPEAPPSMRVPPTSAPLPSPVSSEHRAAETATTLQASSVESGATGARKVVLDKLAAREALSGLDLAGADLSGLDLTGASFAGTDLSSARLSGAQLSRAKLAGVKLLSADLRAATLTHADLTGADLSRATLDGADFTGATLNDANLTLASASSCTFKSAQARRIQLAQTRCEGALFDGADLTGADGPGVELGGASMNDVVASDARFHNARADGAVLHEARLDGADLSGMSLRGATADGVDFSRANLEGADLTRSRFHGSSFKGASLNKALLEGVEGRECSFVSATLAGVNAEGACFEGSDFSDADLRGARFGGARLRDAKISGATAQKLLAPRADFRRVDATRASLRFAKLGGSNFAGASLVDCDLRDADLEGCDLEGTDRTKARLAGAILKGATGIEPDAK